MSKTYKDTKDNKTIWFHSKSGFSTFKKLRRKDRRQKDKQALREGKYDSMPRYRNNDIWDWT